MAQDTEMEGSFMLSRVQRLNKASAPCTVDPKTSLTSCLKVLLVNVHGDSMIFALPAICDPSSRLRARLLGRQLKGREVLEWWGQRYFKREWSAGGEECGMLHKQPPKRPLLHLHLVSEIVHLASHKYQQFMDVAKVCTYTLICFLSHFFLSRMKRSSWREVINTLTIIWFIFSLVLRMKRSSWQEVSNTTGCLPRCSHTRYTWKLRKKSKVIHSSNINLEVRKTV